VQRAQPSSLQPSNFESYGVGADVDCCKRGHDKSLSLHAKSE
jgi:hypothetical protein